MGEGEWRGLNNELYKRKHLVNPLPEEICLALISLQMTEIDSTVLPRRLDLVLLLLVTV